MAAAPAGIVRPSYFVTWRMGLGSAAAVVVVVIDESGQEKKGERTASARWYHQRAR